MADLHEMQILLEQLFQRLEAIEAIVDQTHAVLRSILIAKAWKERPKPSVHFMVARLVSKKRIASGGLDRVITDFHWLKVKYRPIYKILLIVHNCLLGNAPVEIREIIQYGDSSRTMNLQETRFHNKYGCRAFSHVGPKLWNLLPKEIRDVVDTDKFKTALKSFLMLRGEEFCTWANRH